MLTNSCKELFNLCGRKPVVSVVSQGPFSDQNSSKVEFSRQGKAIFQRNTCTLHDNMFQGDILSKNPIHKFYNCYNFLINYVTLNILSV